MGADGYGADGYGDIKVNPVFSIHVFVGVPFSRQKRLVESNDFTVEKRGHAVKFLGESNNLQVAAYI